MFKLSFYVPASHLDIVKQSLFAEGAGRYHGYDQCCWQVLGEGQFQPLPDSQPFIGKINQLETIAEYKVEMICDAAVIKAVVNALLKTHPYEKVAYAIYRIMTVEDL